MAEAKTITASEINFVDESFDEAKANQYHLSILTNGDKFIFSILDTNSNKYLSLQSEKKFPKLNFKSVSCVIAHNKFTLIPSALFEEEKKESLLGFNHEIKKDEEVFVNALHNLDAKNIFAVSKNLVSEIRNKFSNINFIHSSTAFIEGLLVQYKNNSGKKVFVNFYSSHFEIVILEGKELLFSNAFNFQTPEDIAYYILFIYEQLNLNPETIELILSGEIEKPAKEYSLLYTYIRNMKFASRPDGFKYSYKFEEIPSHKYFSLFTQYLCA
ncbi:MAG: DUF3822 family protein [Bacteroidetes bacterium]|nr:DUF3822 family protein [Bacteroidota bacterium]